MKKFSIIFLLFLISNLLFSQKKDLKIEDFFNREIYPETLYQLSWINNTEEYSFVSNNALVRGFIKKRNDDTLVRLKDLNKELERLMDTSMSYFPDVHWINNKSFYFLFNNRFFTFNLENAELVSKYKLNEKADNIDIEPNSLIAAFTVDNNLYISGANGEINLTDEANKEIVYGTTVHRNEFGIEKGTYWSPMGNKLAFYRMDETMVANYPLIDINTEIAEVKNIKYPMAGQNSHEVTIGVYDLISKKTIYLNTGKPKEQYLTNICWSNDEKYIFVAIVNREQNHMKFNQYDAISGDLIKTLFEEKNSKWIEPLNPMQFVRNNPSVFLWQSERDGFNHIYLYDINGKLIRQLTKGNWEVIELMDNDGEYAYFISNAFEPVGRCVQKVNLNTAEITTLTNIKGTNYAVYNYNFKYFINKFSSLQMANQLNIVDNKGKTIKTLLINKNPLLSYKTGETSIFTIKADDNTELYCRMIKPVDFMQGNKYPVLVYVYGGPHSQMVVNDWLAGAGLFLNYIASKGYIVFTLDNRGTNYRGRDFEQAIYRNLGDIEVRDQMKGIEYLKTLDFVDASKIALHGWSYGGFMTLSLMLKHPDAFKVAVAGAPVTDWKFYEVMYGERYMDKPEENLSGYKNSSTLENIDKLNGNLLIIHGTMDDIVVWQHSQLFLKKAILQNKQIDYFIYPDENHSIKGKNRIHLYNKIFNYIDSAIR